MVYVADYQEGIVINRIIPNKAFVNVNMAMRNVLDIRWHVLYSGVGVGGTGE